MEDPHIGRIVYSAEDIARRTDDMAQQISMELLESRIYQIDLLTVLKGAVHFSRDFTTAFQRYNGGRVLVRDQEIRVKSSDGTKSSGSLVLEQDLKYPVDGRNVLIVEDIVDTGLTAKWLIDEMYRRGAVDVVLIAMVDKPLGRKPKFKELTASEEFKPYLSGFVYTGSAWLIGKGLDVNQNYRDLPNIHEYDQTI